MVQEVQQFIFKEQSYGKYSTTTEITTAKKYAEYLNFRYSPKIVNPYTNQMGDFRAIAGNTNTYLHHYFVGAKYIEANIVEILTIDTNTSKEKYYKFDLSSYCILCNKVTTTDGSTLDFTYLHPNPLKKMKRNEYLDYSGISIVPPGSSDTQANSLANEFYEDTIPLFNNLAHSHLDNIMHRIKKITGH